MLNINEEIKTLYKQDSSEKSFNIYFPDLSLTISNPQLVAGSFSLVEDLFTTDSVTYGSCVASQVKFTIADVAQDLTGHTFTIVQNIGGAQITFGSFVVDSCVKQKTLRFKDIVAYDRMKKVEVDVSDWYNSLFPTGSETYTLAQFRASFLAHVGLQEDTSKLPLPNDGLIVSKTISVSQLSGRTVIEAIEEINGCFGHINREGKFTHIILGSAYGDYPHDDYPTTDYPISAEDTSYAMLPDETVTVDMRESIRFEEYTVKEITKLIIRQDTDDVGAIITADKGVLLETLTGTAVSSNKSEDGGKAAISRIEGESSQVVTVQGKNLFDKTRVTPDKSLSNIGTLQDASGFSTSSYISILPSTTYFKTLLRACAWYDVNKTFISYTASVDNIAITSPSNASFIRLHCYTTSLDSGQLELGSTATTYTPFVPNSPSPDYPSPIVSANNFDVVSSIAGRNLFKQSSVDTYGIAGWNVGNATITADSTETYEGAKSIKIVTSSSTGDKGISRPGFNIQGGKNYTWSFIIKSSVDQMLNSGNIMHMQLINGSTVHYETNLSYSPTSLTANTWTKVSVSFYAPSTFEQYSWRAFIWYLKPNATYYVTNFKLEEGVVTTQWTPAPEDIPYNTAVNGVYKANVPHTFRSLHNGVKDTIEVIGDKLYKVQKGNIATYDGSADEVWSLQSINSYGIANFSISLTHNTIGPGARSDRFEKQSTLIANTTNEGFLLSSGTTLYIRIMSSTASTVSAFKTWLSTHITEVQYELATPIYTEITDITLDTYKGLTNIYTTATPQVNFTAKLYGNTNNAYIIEGNFLVYGKSAGELETIGRNIFGYIAKRPYRPYDSSGIGLPYVEVGDRLKYDQDDPVIGYVFSRTLTGIQGLRDNFKAGGSEEQTQNFGLNYEIQQLKGRAARIVKTVDEVSVTLTDLSEEVETSFSLVHGEIELKVDKAGVISSINLSPETIKIEASNIQLEGIVTANSYFKILADGSMEAVNGKFSGELVAASGTFSGNLNAAGGTFSGNLSAAGGTFTGTLSGANGTFTGTLSGNTITSPTINGGAISGTSFTQVGSSYTTTIANGSINTGMIFQSDAGSTSQLNAGNVVLQNGSDNVGLSYGGLFMTAGGTQKAAISVDGDALVQSLLIGVYPAIHAGNVGSYAASVYHTHTSLYDGVAKVTAYGSNFRPHSDTGSNVISCGSPSYLWTQVFAATPVISTSDETLKQQGASLSDAERRVAIKIKDSIKTFKFNDSVNTKGDNARKHTGVYAQEVRKIFEEEGLIVDNYALFCSDTWYEKDGKAVGEGEIPYTAEDEGAIPITRLGIRYEELLCFIVATL